jgi:hypothetical protein
VAANRVNPSGEGRVNEKGLGIHQMRTLFRLTVVQLIVAVLAGLQASSEAVAADLFPDKNLEAAIRAELKKKSEDELKQDDLKNVYFLKAHGKKIANLAGLEKCINLALIDLADNAIKDLKPLAGLKNVQSLTLSNNQIADLAALAKLAKLQYLQLEANQIEKLDALKDLKKLSALYLANNKIKSVAPLAGLERLSSLYLDGNQVTDITPLKKLKWLSSLGLKKNGISNVAPMSNMTELRYTFLEGNKIADISPLVAMAKKDAAGDRRFAPYWQLYLAGNPLNEAAKKTHLAELKKIGVRVKVE